MTTRKCNFLLFNICPEEIQCQEEKTESLPERKERQIRKKRQISLLSCFRLINTYNLINNFIVRLMYEDDTTSS